MRLVAFHTVVLILAARPATGQVRGLYPLGMSAVGGGTLFARGFTYANAFLFYARDEMRGPDGELVATGQQTVMMDMNTIAWATAKPVVLGARFGAAATIPVANNSLTSDVLGPQSGGGGLADSYFQPVMLGWQVGRSDLKALYAFLAPTGRFEAGSSNNVGSGYWTHVVAAGQTVKLDAARRFVLSGFEMWEWHTTQEGTGTQPGQTLSVDYSLTAVMPVARDLELHAGPAGYSQWQTSATTGPSVTPEDEATRYQVHALGLTVTLFMPKRRVQLATRYLQEFAARSTFQGYSFQVSGSVNF